MSTLTRDGAFLISDSWGDVNGGLDGLFLAETRRLSRWTLSIGGTAPQVLSRDSDGSSATVVAAEPAQRGRRPAYEVSRVQAVGADGLSEQIVVTSHSDATLRLDIRYEVEADFADQFELRGDKTYPRTVHRSSAPIAGGLRFDYQRDWYARSSWVIASPEPAVPADSGLGWVVELAAGATWQLNVSVTPDGGSLPAADAMARTAADDVRTFLAPAPIAETGWPTLDAAVRQGLRDIADLRIRLPELPRLRPVGAGVPWFLTLFGRDSLITSYMALPYVPDLAADTLRALAANQGAAHDLDRVEEPGKIVHEVRAGELSLFGDVPYRRYYGTVDATPLFLIVLAQHRDIAGDALTRELETAARAAVAWMRHEGGLDKHGYLVYRTDLRGLVNQGWKDSPDSICFPDGRQATGPIAVCEVQGYAYDALRSVARLARDVWSDDAYADELDALAADVRARFIADFWCDETDFPALALDGSRRHVPTIASNAGHLLWSGVLDADRAARVAQRLLKPDLFSGWGIRTLAAGQKAYHPISYHRGGVWPHDTALAVAGLARSGHGEAAERVARGLIDAASGTGGRLPELITGHERAGRRTPVRYPHACSPQAWSAATPLLLASVLADVTG
jgi:glycogen debranching enzyme